MFIDREELRSRGLGYADSRSMTLVEELGAGIDGSIWGTNRKSAIKVHIREASYVREREVYRRLRERQAWSMCGFQIPRLLDVDDHFKVIEMSIVSPPFVLDFAGSYLDQPPDYSAEVMEQWRAEKADIFGERWETVEMILYEFRRHGIYYMDVSANNIRFAEGPSSAI